MEFPGFCVMIKVSFAGVRSHERRDTPICKFT